MFFLMSIYLGCWIFPNHSSRQKSLLMVFHNLFINFHCKYLFLIHKFYFWKLIIGTHAIALFFIFFYLFIINYFFIKDLDEFIFRILIFSAMHWFIGNLIDSWQIMRFDTSMDSLNVTRSESVADLNSELNGLPHPRRASVGHARTEDNFISTPPKPFGIGKRFVLFLFITNLSKYLQSHKLIWVHTYAQC